MALYTRRSGLESRKYGRRNPSRWPRGTLHPQKLALTKPTSGGRSVGIVRSRTQATELVYTAEDKTLDNHLYENHRSTDWDKGYRVYMGYNGLSYITSLSFRPTMPRCLLHPSWHPYSTTQKSDQKRTGKFPRISCHFCVKHSRSALSTLCPNCSSRFRASSLLLLFKWSFLLLYWSRVPGV
jgi:hypothetical protein